MLSVFRRHVRMTDFARLNALFEFPNPCVHIRSLAGLQGRLERDFRTSQEGTHMPLLTMVRRLFSERDSLFAVQLFSPHHIMPGLAFAKDRLQRQQRGGDERE